MRRDLGIAKARTVDDADLSQELPNDLLQDKSSPRAVNQWHTRKTNFGGAIMLLHCALEL